MTALSRGHRNRWVGFGGLLICLQCLGCQPDPEAEAVELMEALADTAAAQVGQCDAMGKALAEVLEKNKDTIVDLKSLRQGKTESETADLESKFGPKRLAAATKMARAALPCATHPSVIKALKKM